MKNRFIASTLINIIFIFSACEKDEFEPYKAPEPVRSGSLQEITISDHFDWKTSNTISFKFSAKNASGQDLKPVFGIFDPEDRLMASGTIGDNGYFEGELFVPTHLDFIKVKPNYIGLIHEARFDISNQDRITFEFSTQTSNMNLNQLIAFEPETDRYDLGTKFGVSCGYLSTYDGNGVPDALNPIDEIVDADLLEQINSTLPEGKPVPQYHPQYISEGVETDLRITQRANVQITFIHEGAGYRNSLGYYTYDLNNPPQSVNDITNCKMVFPNLSFNGSGGAMDVGNTINLGDFEAGTGIGWYLVANGWNGSGVSESRTTYYSNSDFNPESSASSRRHMVLVKDPSRELFVFGFEDLNRETQNSDDDFNDAMFYITANPYEAVEVDNIQLIDVTDDADGDGVSDLFDQFPNDAARAFAYYFPADNQFSTIAFEDLWPSKGDYDYNDLVIDHHFELITNNQNRVTQIEAEFMIKGVVAGYQSNAFALELPISSSDIASVNGTRLTEGLFGVAGNNVENGGSKCIIPIFDHAGKNFTSAESPDTIRVSIVFNRAIDVAELGTPPFNPFLVVGQNRGREVHLAGYEPTIHADQSIFGTANDNTVLGMNNTYYKTAENLPWAISIPYSFNYPQEGIPIDEAYNYFTTWAASGGSQLEDWYVNNPDYRRNERLTFTGW